LKNVELARVLEKRAERGEKIKKPEKRAAKEDSKPRKKAKKATLDEGMETVLGSVF
jgi:hypothetical protein